MFMNLENFEVYKSELDPNFKGPAVEVDEMILPAIVVLNKKGYTTNFCCSGHIHSELSRNDCKRLQNLNYAGGAVNDTYISFRVSFEAFKNLKEHCPEDFKIKGDEVVVFDKGTRFIMRKIVTGDDYFDRLIDVYNNCTNLYKMALELPDITIKEEN